MKKLLIVVFISTSLCLGGCTKGEDEQTTIFEGTVQLSVSDYDMEEIKVEIFGNEYEGLFSSKQTFNKVYPVESNGQFAITVSSSKEDTFSIGLRHNGVRVLTDCAANCSGFKPGKKHSNITLSILEFND